LSNGLRRRAHGTARPIVFYEPLRHVALMHGRFLRPPPLWGRQNPFLNQSLEFRGQLKEDRSAPPFLASVAPAGNAMCAAAFHPIRGDTGPAKTNRARPDASATERQIRKMPR